MFEFARDWCQTIAGHCHPPRPSALEICQSDCQAGSATLSPHPQLTFPFFPSIPIITTLILRIQFIPHKTKGSALLSAAARHGSRHVDRAVHYSIVMLSVIGVLVRFGYRELDILGMGMNRVDECRRLSSHRWVYLPIWGIHSLYPHPYRRPGSGCDEEEMGWGWGWEGGVGIGQV